MESTRFSFLYRDLLPSAETLEKTIGYMPGESPEPVTELIKAVLESVSDQHDAKAEYRIFNNIGLFPSEKVITLNGTKFDVKTIIYNQIKKSEELALFICTAGEKIGVRSRECMKSNDLLRGYIYDVVGSAIVESAADRMQNELQKIMAASGRHITNRFSPGYCGWDVSQQHYLFSFFPNNYCGITLSESALMSPIKSVSGIIGIGKEVRFGRYQCQLCDERTCLYRNRR